MGTKTISIMDDAYRLLARNKKKDESFSDVIRREFSKKGKISECAGLWSDMSDEQFEQLEKAIMGIRKSVTRSLLKRVK